MPEPPSALTPAAQARLTQVQSGAGQAASSAAALPSAATQAGQARAAVSEPAAETTARASGDLAAALDEQPAPSPQLEELCRQIQRIIRSKRPPDEETLVQADPASMAREAGGELNSAVEGDARQVQGGYQEINQAPEGTPQQEGQPLAGPPPAGPTPDIGAQAAAPDPVPAANVSLDADAAAAQSRIDQAGMNTEAAQLIQTGPVAEARAAQGELQQMAERDPAEVLAAQQAALTSAQGDMAALQQRALDSLLASRATTAGNTASQQTSMVGGEEQRRAQAGARAQAIFNAAQTQVNALLDPLPRTAMAQWDAGVGVLSEQFKQRLKRVEDWIRERHAGGWGTVVEFWDELTGLPDWVQEEYDAAEQDFGDGVCALIRKISTDVNGVIASCEAIIQDSRRQIAEVFAALPIELQGWAAGEQERLGAQLDGLGQRAAQTRDTFNQDLARRASQAVQEVREQIHALREAAKGVLGRLASAVEDFLEDPGRAIINGLLTLVGIPPASFWALVARIQQVIADIADDPARFANNLLAALAQGFEQFFDHIGTHLLQGLLDWLFAAMPSVGVALPKDLSLKSIITFFLQLMGITWPRIRKLLVKHIGEKNVALIERAWSLISTLIDQGPEGIFEMLKEQLSPKNILDMILQMAIDYLVETLIKQAAARLLLMLNPVGAIAQAIEAIYRVLKWVFQNAARIFSLVETVVNGIWDILNGNLSGMAKAIEKALASLIPMVIAFLADYLGLGDLPTKVAEAVKKLQDWVEGIMDKVIGWLVEQGKRLLAALGLGKKEDKKAEYDNQVGKTVPWTAAGEFHKMWVVAEGGGATVMVSSREVPVSEQLDDYEGMANELTGEKDKERRETVLSHIADARGKLSELDQVADQLTQDVSVGDETKKEAIASEDAEVENEEDSLAMLLKKIRQELGLSEGVPTGLSSNDPIPIQWMKPLSLYVESITFTRGGLAGVTVSRNQPRSVPVGIRPGETILLGVPSEYWPEVGKRMQYIPEERGSAVEQLRAVLDYYGLRRRELGVQMDHVQDLQFEGADLPENVWPFDSSANMSAGPRQRDQIVTYRDEKTNKVMKAAVGELPGRYFVIARIGI